MKKCFILMFLAAAALVAFTDRDDDVTSINIRIQNSTASFFQEVRIAGKDTIYENIAAGEYSNYLEFQETFQTMALTVVADSANFEITPSNDILEPLPIRFYTYEFSLNDANQLELTFKLD